jgi:hypothetical protein
MRSSKKTSRLLHRNPCRLSLGCRLRRQAEPQGRGDVTNKKEHVTHRIEDFPPSVQRPFCFAFVLLRKANRRRRKTGRRCVCLFCLRLWVFVTSVKTKCFLSLWHFLRICFWKALAELAFFCSKHSNPAKKASTIWF